MGRLNRNPSLWVNAPAQDCRKSGALATLLAATILMFLGLNGCTFIGVDHPAMRESMSFGAERYVNMCVLLDKGIAREDAETLLATWEEEASKYDLHVNAISYQEMPRSGFFFAQIMDQLKEVPLGPGCDRLIYFVNRNAGDYVYGLAAISFGLPEVLGEVDDATLTRGYVVAKFGSPTQVVLTPKRVAQHEIYHLLGCPKHFDMPDCYRRIRDLKRVEKRLEDENYYFKSGEKPFYPTWASGGDSMLISRAQVNAYSKRPVTTVAAMVLPP